MNKLPVKWRQYELGEVVEIHDNERKPINNSERNTRIENKDNSSLYPYYGATGQVGWIDDFLSDQESVLVGEDAAPFLDPIKNKAYLVSGKFWVNNHAHILRGLKGLVSNKFILHQMNHVDYRDHVSGSTRLKLTKSALCKMPFILCSYKEQGRIVDKIEELFSELDEGVKELKAAQNKLSQYRQSLLKSAVEGSLTQQWRAENSDQVQETGEQLLARILKQRREQWQQQKLAEFAEKGKIPPKNWQDKYPEPVQPDTTVLPELPEGWVWASMSQISQIQGGIQKQPKRRPVENKYPFLRVANVYRNELRLDEIHEIELFGDELQRLSLLKGDILIVEGNGSKSEIGRCAIWNNEIENAVHQNHLIRTRPVLALSKYVALWLNSPAGMDIMSTLAATTSGLYTLSVSKISKIPVPIPSLCEQKAIADKIDMEFDAIDRQIEATALGLKQSEAQRKNILKSAFSGQLVPQDPNDEPASVLLEKIKQEREALAQIPKPRKPSKPKKKVDLMNTLLEVLTAEKDWIDAQDAFRKCGIADGSSTDRIEEIYTELRKLEKAGKIEIQRQGDFDQLKLIKQDVKED
ncbi:restriction endonuclease subunit S [Vibrio cholerae]|uniref:restriction endonuclease subunit S n=1 Tax=Vibrio cholerae TaxID=666 RepID=UPI001651D35F|nr:restriction endonuclease subunit S [Vibrio cholerae]EIN5952183.1 restriction endonuclease subunit S [Vibrio cholerae]EIV0335301.1 restriction endonuclease subunit S [Vibrio cholerae]MCX9579758.1 restriction endonuclease subunit S [Vibrio cholerae]MDX5007631.1 restriction endonuclease subunit S [Vibrio cholerae]HDL8937284.1 restriction endonuclease subunit S [Vibrio cholerae]